MLNDKMVELVFIIITPSNFTEGITFSSVSQILYPYLLFITKPKFLVSFRLCVLIKASLTPLS